MCFDANQIGPFCGSQLRGELKGIITTAQRTVFSDNIIDPGATCQGSVQGIQAYTDDSTQSKYLFNTIYLRGTSSNSISNAFSLASSGSQYVSTDTILGNIFFNTRICRDNGFSNQTSFALYNLDSVAYCDFNLLSVGSDSAGDNRYVMLARNRNTQTFNSLLDLQSSSWWGSHDQHSISVPVALRFRQQSSYSNRCCNADPKWCTLSLAGADRFRR